MATIVSTHLALRAAQKCSFPFGESFGADDVIYSFQRAGRAQIWNSSFVGAVEKDHEAERVRCRFSVERRD